MVPPPIASLSLLLCLISPAPLAALSLPASRLPDPQFTSPHARLVLVRHGQSEWNLANRFTGWVDVDLTERGIREASLAGQVLFDAGIDVDRVVTSSLRRAIRTAWLMLMRADQCWVPLLKNPDLNEQHSGALTGQNKKDLAEKFGVDQVMAWRRLYDHPPRAISADDPLQRAMLDDGRYVQLGASVPFTESLKDTCVRVGRAWECDIAPALRKGETVLVVSHGNTLRALIKHVEGLSDEQVFHLDMPTAAPVLYELDAALEPGPQRGTWGTSDVPRRGKFLLPEELIADAQRAMREQVVRDIAVSTIRSDAGFDARVATCDAWTPATASSTRVELDGKAFRVRQTPPSAFADLVEEDSCSYEARARREVGRFLKSLPHGLQVGDDIQARALPPSGADVVLGVPVVRAGRLADGAAPAAVLVLLRHGYSEWNEENRFTGWADVELTNRGRDEARLAGSMLRELRLGRIERCYTSLLKRAIQTAWLMLDEMELPWVPMEHSWRLNERHYGLLQGQEKNECRRRHGISQVFRWRRGYTEKPPPWNEDQAAATIDRRYAGLRKVPRSESLAECTERMLPFICGRLMEDMRAAVEADTQRVEAGGKAGPPPVFIVVSSENLIRALAKAMDGLSEDEVSQLDVPYATPLIYHFDEQLRPLRSALARSPLKSGWFVGDPERVEAVQLEIAGQLGCNGLNGDDDEGCELEPELEPQSEPAEFERVRTDGHQLIRPLARLPV